MSPQRHVIPVVLLAALALTACGEGGDVRCRPIDA